MLKEQKVFEATGARPGSCGPVGLKMPVYLDQGLEDHFNYIVGANKDGFHLKNVNRDRDFQVKTVGDFRFAKSLVTQRVGSGAEPGCSVKDVSDRSNPAPAATPAEVSTLQLDDTSSGSSIADGRESGPFESVERDSQRDSGYREQTASDDLAASPALANEAGWVVYHPRFAVKPC